MEASSKAKTLPKLKVLLETIQDNFPQVQLTKLSPSFRKKCLEY